MPEPEMKPGDIFYVIGFTNDEVANGVQMRTMNLGDQNMKAMIALHGQLGPLAVAAQRGVVVKKIVEVYFLDQFSFFDEDDVFEKQFGDKYIMVEYFNEPALALSKRFGIQLPPVIGKITRAELPKPLGISMRFPSYLPAAAVGAA
jgi:hypothetical protein